MALSTQLYLCRHGQSVWNQQALLQGQQESPLSVLGKQQALTLAHKITAWNISQVVSSSLGRAIQTAQICAKHSGLQTRVIDGIAERHFGQWQGLRLQDITEYSAFCQQRYAQPELRPGVCGESTHEVQQRMQQTLVTLAKQHLGDKLLVISHGDALACLMSLWTPAIELANIGGIHLSYQNQQLHWEGLLV